MRRISRGQLLLLLSLIILLLVGCRGRRNRQAAEEVSGDGLFAPEPTETPIPPTLRPTLTPQIASELAGVEVDVSYLDDERYLTRDELFAQTLVEDTTPGVTPTLAMTYDEAGLNAFAQAYVLSRLLPELEFTQTARLDLRAERVAVLAEIEGEARTRTAGVLYGVAEAPNQVVFTKYELSQIVFDDPPDPVLEQVSVEVTDFVNEALASARFTSEVSNVRYRIVQLTFEENLITVLCMPG